MFMIEWVAGAKIVERAPSDLAELAQVVACARRMAADVLQRNRARAPDRFRVLDEDLDQVAIERI
ncbi:MAG TPA: hypothetical protein VGS12_01705 [Caulobacteraceae bacterium]|nr:hypothetical protein [Caulobacteraceae bacterium]